MVVRNSMVAMGKSHGEEMMVESLRGSLAIRMI